MQTKKHFSSLFKYFFYCLFVASMFSLPSFAYATTVSTTTSTTVSTTGVYLNSFLKFGSSSNNSNEVIKLQQFLRDYEGFTNLAITGVFDQPTLDAVLLFQRKYWQEILKPWGYVQPTGIVYLLTKNKINEIVLATTILLSEAENQEVNTYRTAYLARVEKSKNESVTSVIAVAPVKLSEIIIAPIATPSAKQPIPTVQPVSVDVPSIVFSLPHGTDVFEAVVLFIVSILFLNVMATYTGNRALVFSIGSVVAMLAVSLFNRAYLVLPFIFVLAISAFVFFRNFYKKDSQNIFSVAKKPVSTPTPTSTFSSVPSSLILPMLASVPMLDMMSEGESHAPELTREDVHTLSEMLDQEIKQ